MFVLQAYKHNMCKTIRKRDIPISKLVILDAYLYVKVRATDSALIVLITNMSALFFFCQQLF